MSDVEAELRAERVENRVADHLFSLMLEAVHRMRESLQSPEQARLQFEFDALILNAVWMLSRRSTDEDAVTQLRETMPTLFTAEVLVRVEAMAAHLRGWHDKEEKADGGE